MDDVAIIGIGLHPFGRFGACRPSTWAPTRPRQALRDAGVDWNDVQFAFGGQLRGRRTPRPTRWSAGSGLTGLPFMNVDNGCATAGDRAAAALPTRSAPASTTSASPSA